MTGQITPQTLYNFSNSYRTATNLVQQRQFTNFYDQFTAYIQLHSDFPASSRTDIEAVKTFRDGIVRETRRLTMEIYTLFEMYYRMNVPITSIFDRIVGESSFTFDSALTILVQEFQKMDRPLGSLETKIRNRLKDVQEDEGNAKQSRLDWEKKRNGANKLATDADEMAKGKKKKGKWLKAAGYITAAMALVDGGIAASTLAAASALAGNIAGNLAETESGGKLNEREMDEVGKSAQKLETAKDCDKLAATLRSMASSFETQRSNAEGDEKRHKAHAKNLSELLESRSSLSEARQALRDQIIVYIWLFLGDLKQAPQLRYDQRRVGHQQMMRDAALEIRPWFLLFYTKIAEW